MKLGVYTACIPEYSPEEGMRIIKELGYDGVEWRVWEGVPRSLPDQYDFESRYWSTNLCSLDLEDMENSATQLKKICVHEKVEVCSLTTYLSPWDTEKIDTALKAAEILECRNIRVLAPEYDGSDHYRLLLDRTLKQIEQLEKLAKGYGKRVNFEQHMKTIIPSASAAYRLVSNFDPDHIGVIFDPGNMVFEGFENYQMTLELLGDYLAHVHIKNSAWKLVKTSEDGVHHWEADWAPLKTGYADLRKVIRLLKERKYNGYL